MNMGEYSDVHKSNLVDLFGDPILYNKPIKEIEVSMICGMHIRFLNFNILGEMEASSCLFKS